jgi:hypothetical protein
MWEKRGFGNKGEGQDFSRADVLGYAVWAWPANEKVAAWLAANWERWEREAPAFFNEKWRKRIQSSAPREALPPALKRKFNTADANKRKYRRASAAMVRRSSLVEHVSDRASAKIAPK